jgi:hypothetical protein
VSITWVFVARSWLMPVYTPAANIATVAITTQPVTPRIRPQLIDLVVFVFGAFMIEAPFLCFCSNVRLVAGAGIEPNS